MVASSADALGGIQHQQHDVRHADVRRAMTTLSFSAMSLVLPLRRMPAVSTKM